MITVAPSILSADFTRLGEEAESIRNAGADWLHFDVMDGVFVPNITIGQPVLRSLRKATDMFIDVHLMIERPGKFAEEFCEAGADMLVFHLEAEPDAAKVIEKIHMCGKQAGLALKPGTPAETLLPYIGMVDMVLIMTVEPGFGGQSFMPDMLPKLRLLRKASPKLRLEVDGGMNESTAALVREAGADTIVAGSYVFRAADRKAAIASLRG